MIGWRGFSGLTSWLHFFFEFDTVINASGGWYCRDLQCGLLLLLPP